MNTLNNWYNSNLASYETDYIDTGTGFCSDRNLQSGSWSPTEMHTYAAYGRMRSGSPSLQCGELDILSQSNGKLPNPIGLITADEAMLGGIPDGGSGKGNYLYIDEYYWTMSPCDFLYGEASVYIISDVGYLRGSTYSKYSIRPVINIRSDVQITGSGTTTDPFRVVGAS